MSHLNFFEPYESKKQNHEDQLTRALLITLELVPLARYLWLELVDRAHRENGGGGLSAKTRLLRLTTRTQVESLPQVDSVISVVISDALFKQVAPVQKVARAQRLDGVLALGSQVGIVVENKLHHTDVYQEQLSFDAPEETDISPRLSAVAWKEVLSAFNDMILSELVSGAEKLVLEHFLSFVDRHNPHLGPYQTLGICGVHPYRLNRRCRDIMTEIAIGDVEYHRGSGYYIELGAWNPVRKIFLAARGQESETSLALELYPGDTVSQARGLYERIRPDKISALVAEGWDVRSNFHLGFMSSGLVWPHVSLSLDEYSRYWADNRHQRIGQVRREEFGEFFDHMVESGHASHTDRLVFDKSFTNTARNSLNVCPGLRLERRWELSEAVAADDQGQFGPMVRDAIASAFALWGSELPVPTQATE